MSIRFKQLLLGIAIGVFAGVFLVVFATKASAATVPISSEVEVLASTSSGVFAIFSNPANLAQSTTTWSIPNGPTAVESITFPAIFTFPIAVPGGGGVFFSTLEVGPPTIAIPIDAIGISMKFTWTGNPATYTISYPGTGGLESVYGVLGVTEKTAIFLFPETIPDPFGFVVTFYRNGNPSGGLVSDLSWYIPSAVPEPSVYVMFFCGLSLISINVWRKSRKFAVARI